MNDNDRRLPETVRPNRHPSAANPAPIPKSTLSATKTRAITTLVNKIKDIAGKTPPKSKST